MRKIAAYSRAINGTIFTWKARNRTTEQRVLVSILYTGTTPEVFYLRPPIYRGAGELHTERKHNKRE